MKKLIIAAMMCMPLTLMAQNSWEEQEDVVETNGNVTHVNPDQKYLAGAVPEVDGRVTFTKTISAPGKSADQVFDIVSKYLQKMTKEKNQFEQSRLVENDKAKHEVVGSYQEWLVFKSTALVLDRTRLYYTLTVNCKDGAADVTMTRIYYLYDEERDATTYKAEEWITDQYGLKKNKDKLSRVSGKFRKKTIDRKDFIFNKLQSLLK